MFSVNHDHESRRAEETCIFLRVGDEKCGISMAEVQKVTEFNSLNRIPRLPPALMGISHYHGRVITVLSLAWLLAEDAGGSLEVQPDVLPSPKPGQRLVILSRDPRNIALLADQLLGTGTLQPLEQHSLRRRGLSAGQYRGQVIQKLDVDWVFEHIASLAESVSLESG